MKMNFVSCTRALEVYLTVMTMMTSCFTERTSLIETLTIMNSMWMKMMTTLIMTRTIWSRPLYSPTISETDLERSWAMGREVFTCISPKRSTISTWCRARHWRGSCLWSESFQENAIAWTTMTVEPSS